MVKQKAFFYSFEGKPGLGILATHEYEKWHRANFYAFGADMDFFYKEVEQHCGEELLDRKTIASHPAQSKVIIAGGVVFKGLTCLAGEDSTAGDVMGRLEELVPDFEVLDAPAMQEVPFITPLDVYFFTYGRKVIGISRVVFFEYATQVALVGIYRDQDRNLVDEMYRDLSGLSSYMTIPNPLRTDERDPRVEVNMFMIRHPLKEELQSDFVSELARIPELTFYSS